MVQISMAVRSILMRLGPSPKAAAEAAAASVAAAAVAVQAVVVAVDRASAASPAGNAHRNRKYGGRRLGSAADV
jgi:MoxR-like ATPase